MAEQNQIDISAGLVPANNQVDISAGLVPAQMAPDHPSEGWHTDAQGHKTYTDDSGITYGFDMQHLLNGPDIPDSFRTAHPVLSAMNRIGDVAKEIDIAPSIGGLKGVGDTLIDADNLVRKGLNKIGGNYDQIEKPDWLESQNAGESVGKVGETVLEFMLGDEVLKGLSTAQKLRKLAPIAELMERYPRLANLLGTAIRQGTVSTGQGLLHGESPEEAVRSGLLTAGISGGAGAFGEAGSLLRKIVSPRTIEEGNQLAEDLASTRKPSYRYGRDNDVQFSSRDQDYAEEFAKEKGGKASDVKQVQPAFRNPLVIDAPNGKFADPQYEKPFIDQAKKAGHDGVIFRNGNDEFYVKFRNVRVPLPDQQGVVSSVNQKIDAAEQAMHSTYDAGMKSVLQKAQAVPIKLSGSALQKTAAELLGDSNVPKEISASLKGVVPDSAKLNPLLEELATSPKTYSWSELEATRQQLGQQIRKLPFDSPIKPDLIRLRSAIDETMQTAASDAGKPELAQQIKTLRSNYAQTTNQLTEQSVKALKNDPDSIAKVLLGKTDSISRIQNLRSLIGPENMKEVEGSLFQNMLDRAAQGDQFNPKVLKKAFYNMAPEIRDAVWGDRLNDVKRFVDATSNPIAKIKGAAALGALTLGGWRIARSDDPMRTAERELVLALGGYGALHISARSLSNPEVLKAVSGFMEQSGKPGTRKALATAANQVMLATMDKDNESASRIY